MKKLTHSVALTLTLFGCVGAPPEDQDSAEYAVVARSLPRMIAPLHGAVIGTQRPVFRVEGPVPANARLELCADRGCTVVEQRTPYYAQAVQTVGTLSPGLHFWRVADDSSASTAWAFYVPHRDGNQSSTTAYIADFNGDGAAEYAAKQWGARASAAVFVQGAEATVYHVLEQLVPERPDALHSLGDVNGDGFSDIAVFVITGGVRVTAVYLGSPRGPESQQGPAFTGNVRLRGVGDVNRDGFADALMDTLDVAIPSSRNAGAIASALHLGGPAGIAATPTRRWDRPVHPAGDVNGDGFADLRVDEAVESGGVIPRFYLGGRDLAAMRVRSIVRPAGRSFSTVVSDVGDLNGDGLNDVVVFANDGVYFYFPTTAGFRAVPDDRLGPLPITRWGDHDISFEMPSPRYFRGVGDLNGDGFGDIALQVRGRPVRGGFDTQFLWRIDGRVGGVAAPSFERSTTYFPPQAHWVGDLDANGLDDLLLFGGGYPGNSFGSAQLAFAAAI